MAKKSRRKQKPSTISEQLKRAIQESQLTHYRIGKNAGIGADIIDRFMSGKRPNLQLRTVNKLCQALGLQLTKIEDS